MKSNSVFWQYLCIRMIDRAYFRLSCRSLYESFRRRRLFCLFDGLYFLSASTTWCFYGRGEGRASGPMWLDGWNRSRLSEILADLQTIFGCFQTLSIFSRHWANYFFHSIRFYFSICIRIYWWRVNRRAVEFKPSLIKWFSK